MFVFIITAVRLSRDNVYESLQASMQTLESCTISTYDFFAGIIMYTSIVFFVFITGNTMFYDICN